MAAAVIAATGLHKRLGGVAVLRGVDLQLAPGERHALIGPNGAGKTTVFDVLSGRTRPDAGRVLLDGADITRLPPHARVRLGLGRSFQASTLFARLSAGETLQLAAMQAGGPAAGAAMLEAIGLAARQDVPAGQLAYAEQRLLEIGTAALCGRRVLLLDEPTAGLSQAETAAALALIRRLSQGRTLLLIEHDLEVVFALADRVSVLERGRVIACGPPGAVRADPAVQRAYLARPPREPPPPPATPPPLLEVRGLRAGYGGVPVLNGLDLAVGAGEVVALLGRNGAGRSTALRAVMGLLPRTGQVALGGVALPAQPHAAARAGLGYVAEGRAVFRGLTVAQNLRLGAKYGPGPAIDPYALFPALRPRALAGTLSGGEAQMLALCRTLMGRPRMLLVDEPTEGLAPAMADQVAALLRRVAGQGVGVLLVEQKLAIALTAAHRVCVLGGGRIVFDGTPAAFAANERVQQEWLEVAGWET